MQIRFRLLNRAMCYAVLALMVVITMGARPDTRATMMTTTPNFEIAEPPDPIECSQISYLGSEPMLPGYVIRLRNSRLPSVPPVSARISRVELRYVPIEVGNPFDTVYPFAMIIGFNSTPFWQATLPDRDGDIIAERGGSGWQANDMYSLLPDNTSPTLQIAFFNGPSTEEVNDDLLRDRFNSTKVYYQLQDFDGTWKSDCPPLEIVEEYEPPPPQPAFCEAGAYQLEFVDLQPEGYAAFRFRNNGTRAVRLDHFNIRYRAVVSGQALTRVGTSTSGNKDTIVVPELWIGSATGSTAIGTFGFVERSVGQPGWRLTGGENVGPGETEYLFFKFSGTTGSLQQFDQRPSDFNGTFVYLKNDTIDPNCKVVTRTLTDTPQYDTPALYSLTTARFLTYNPLGSLLYQFTYGAVNDPDLVPIAGDWNGDGIDTIGLYNKANSAWILSDDNYGVSYQFPFGVAGQPLLPIVGDWDSDGDDTVGLYNPANGAWLLSNTNASVAPSVTYIYGGFADAVPLPGDWDGDGDDTPGLYNPANSAFILANEHNAAPYTAFPYGEPSLKPVKGDFDANDTDTIGMWQSINGIWLLLNTNASIAPQLVLNYGMITALDAPLTGKWGVGGSGGANNIDVAPTFAP